MMNYNTDSMNFTDKPDLEGDADLASQKPGPERETADTHTRVTTDTS